MHCKKFLLGAALALGYTPIPAVAGPLGPVELHEQLSLLGARLSYGPHPVFKGSSFEVVAASSNTFIEEDSYRLDEEVRSVALRGRYALNSEQVLYAAAPLLWRGGGFADDIIDSWHQFFSLPRGGRNRTPDDQYFNGGFDTEGSAFSFDDEGFALGNVVVGFDQKLWHSEDAKGLLALNTRVSLPTARGSYGHRGIDGSVGLGFQQEVGALQFSLGAAALLRGDSSLYGVEYEELVGAYFGYVEWGFSEDWSLGVGLHGTSSQVDNVPGFPGHTLYLDTTIGYRLSPERALQLLIRENPSPQEGSADFSVAVQFVTSLGP